MKWLDKLLNKQIDKEFETVSKNWKEKSDDERSTLKPLYYIIKVNYSEEGSVEKVYNRFLRRFNEEVGGYYYYDISFDEIGFSVEVDIDNPDIWIFKAVTHPEIWYKESDYRAYEVPGVVKPYKLPEGDFVEDK